MGTRVAMVNSGKLRSTDKIRKSMFGSVEDKETAIYENGMIEVLTELARMHFLKFDVERVDSPAYLQVYNDSQALLEELNETLSEPQRALLDESSNLAACQQHLELEDIFVRGFIHGYRFLKQLTESRRD